VNTDTKAAPLHELRSDVTEARELVKRASRMLERVGAKCDERLIGTPLVWTADVVREELDTIAHALEDALRGDEPVVRVDGSVAVGKPFGEDAGGGFAWRVLQALALLREAWVRADQNNRPRITKALAWTAYAWLETAGYSRAAVVRQVLGRGLDGEKKKAEIVAHVNGAIARDVHGLSADALKPRGL
jgi:hypothetical protein